LDKWWGHGGNDPRPKLRLLSKWEAMQIKWYCTFHRHWSCCIDCKLMPYSRKNGDEIHCGFKNCFNKLPLEYDWNGNVLVPLDFKLPFKPINE